MWKAGLSITGTLLSLYTAGASAQDGVMCNSRAHGEVVNNELETNVKNLAIELCETHLKEGGHNPFIRNSGPGGYALTITHSEEDLANIGTEECTAHFNDIVEQCILEAGVWGGMAHVNGLMYEISQDDASSSAGSLDTRATTKAKKPKAKTPTKKPATTPKQKGKPTPTPKGKATPTPPSKTKPTPTPKATPTPADNACAFTPGGKNGKPGKGGKLAARTGCSVWPPPNAHHDGWKNIEHYGTADTSDLVTTNLQCASRKKTKRNFLEVAFGTPMTKRTLDFPVNNGLEKRSGDRYAKTWAGWEKGKPAHTTSLSLVNPLTLHDAVLADLDVEFAKVAAANGKPATKITIIWAGGITGVRLGSRGRNGKTGDIDFLYHTKTTADEKKWFFEAISTVVAKPEHDLPSKPPPITNSLELNSKSPIPATRLAEWSLRSDAEPAAYEGKSFIAKDGDMLFQLYGKIARMYDARRSPSKQDQNANPPRMYGQHKQRDEQDAKFFLKQWTAKHGALDIADLVTVGKPAFFNKSKADMEALCGPTMKIIAGEALTGVGPSIKAAVAEEDKLCAKWAEEHPFVPKPKLGPQAGKDKAPKKGGPSGA
jgi:hypothetical protein